MLDVDTLATAVLERIEQSPDQRPDRQRTLRWSKAGHPPPWLRHPDGAVVLLSSEPADLLLGYTAHTVRTEQHCELGAGSTVVLYTDWLVERRDEALDDSLLRLQRVLLDHGHLAVDQLCQEILRRIPSQPAEDDMLLLVGRTT